MNQRTNKMIYKIIDILNKHISFWWTIKWNCSPDQQLFNVYLPFTDSDCPFCIFKLCSFTFMWQLTRSIRTKISNKTLYIYLPYCLTNWTLLYMIINFMHKLIKLEIILINVYLDLWTAEYYYLSSAFWYGVISYQICAHWIRYFEIYLYFN